MKSIAALVATVLLMGIDVLAASSQPVLINTSPTRNGRWSLVSTNNVPLSWTWDESAVRAELTLTGMHSTETVPFNQLTTNWIWQVCSTPIPSMEDVVDLKLRFYDASESVTGVLTSQLTVITGAFGVTSVIPDTTGRRWNRVPKGVGVVIPYDATWIEATAPATVSRLVIACDQGLVQTNLMSDTSGFYGWNLQNSDWGYGTFYLSLDFPGTDGMWDAVLTRVAEGSMILLL